MSNLEAIITITFVSVNWVEATKPNRYSRLVDW